MKQSWNLDDIFRLDEFEALYKATRTEIAQFDEYFAKMSPEMLDEDFATFSFHHEQCVEHLHRLSARPELMLAINQKDSTALKLKNQVKDLEIFFSEKIQPISLWLKGKRVKGKPILDDKNANRLFAVSGDLRYLFSYARKIAKYSLSTKEEKIIAAKDANGISVINDLRDLIETELEYDFRPEGGKRRKIKNLAELNSYTFSPDPAERKAAFVARFEQYQKNIEKFFLTYQAIVKDWNFEAKLRGYNSPISVRNIANHIPDTAIDTLIDVCSNNRFVFQAYFKQKAKELGMEKLSRYDLYAPLNRIDKTFTIQQAIEIILNAFNRFSNNFANRAKQIIDQNHLDSHPGKMKRSGAFCWTVSPNITPYVLMNFANKLRDVSTLAHELGHAVHSLYANIHSVSSQHANLPLAETASTFAEMIVFEDLLAQAKDPSVKKQLLADKLADSYASIMRQNYFVKFEILAHEKIQTGIEEHELSQMWLDNLHEQFGDSVEIDDIFRYEWAYIPHIHHTPFYCYAYNFGELLSMALYAQYKAEGKSFIPKLEQILAYGGTEDPVKILKTIEVDMESPEFWQNSFELIKIWQNEFESL